MINEGSSGRVFETAEPGVVVKIAKRTARGNLTIKEQFKMQHRVWSILNFEGYKVLYTPKPLKCIGNSYTMEKIDDSNFIGGAELAERPELVVELHRLYDRLKSFKVCPNDFELYPQPDGRVAMIDYDKFIRL